MAEKRGGHGTRIIGAGTIMWEETSWLLLQPVRNDADRKLNGMQSALRVPDEGASWGPKLFIVGVV